MKLDVFQVGQDQRFVLLAMDSRSFDDINTAAAHAAVTVGDFLAAVIQSGMRAEFVAACDPGQSRLFDAAAHAAPMNVRGRRKGEVRAVRRGAETLWTVAQVADRTGLGRSTIGRAIAFGEIAVIRPTIGGKSIQIPEHQVVEFCRLYLPGYTAKNAKRNG